ncbi:MAG: helix-turn-helix transcriptional regulator [Anaerolineaceae bacterium]|nr:helix-turn-helix transcriptional regulator [Anaerolineaceae bacterium]
MTWLLFLLNDQNFLVLKSDLAAGALVAAIRSGNWTPPPPYDALLPNPPANEQPRFSAIRQGRLVVIAPHPYPRLVRRPSMDEHKLTLSPRQSQILQFLSEGLTIKEIASRLKLHPRTVGLHIAALKARLGGSTLSHSIGKATILGLCRPKKGK